MAEGWLSTTRISRYERRWDRAPAPDKKEIGGDDGESDVESVTSDGGIQYCLSWEESEIEWSDDGEEFSEYIPSDSEASNSEHKLPSNNDHKTPSDSQSNPNDQPIPRTAKLRVRPVGIQLALGANSERAVQTDGNRARLEAWKEIVALGEDSETAAKEALMSDEIDTVQSGKRRRNGKRRGKGSKKKHQNKQKRRQAKAGHLVPIHASAPLEVQTHGYVNLRLSNQQNVLNYMAEVADILLGQYRLSIPPCSFAIPCPLFGQAMEHVPRYWMIHVPNFFSEQDARIIWHAYMYAMDASPKQLIRERGKRHLESSVHTEHEEDTIYSQILHLGDWARAHQTEKGIYTTAETIQKRHIRGAEAAYRLLFLCVLVNQYLMSKAAAFLKAVDKEVVTMSTQ
ncbi:hypothetical protein TREMEDRAFT_60381 [Tremella mesenterica DSM 1558]|uniref:uncharacterized protein n=1 Tax=Tremella mesenterica (strain ATCC 24925 / CBS 8224 / DSM 1558 / NBRC 9311 / NRRL Y-6157 / RJB 2259-6 / UBC 559-6) TaxID=578456 RepID=UPI0003F49B84|nr:uncharacterized protein TREMEDRAFT_60381 [Tremella mesenterica DSM 1558]EIW71452.1 hypothetical protein TREMEDRAFT_60381 [Tremella mesenterica DSM 1558]